MKLFFRLSLFLLFVFAQTGCTTFSGHEEDDDAMLAPVEDKSSSQNPYAAIKQKLAEDNPAIQLFMSMMPRVRIEKELILAVR